MSCDRYWRAGILLVERGEPDPHRETCADCRREHAAREELVRALGQVGSSGLAPEVWQAQVWRRIDRLDRRRPWPAWAFGLAGAAAAAIALFLLVRPPPKKDLPRLAVVEEVKGAERRAVRDQSDSAWRTVHSGSKVRISARREVEIRVYRGNELLQRCTFTAELRVGCGTERDERYAEVTLDLAGDYTVAFIDSATAEPRGTFDTDMGAVVAAGGNFESKKIAAE